MIVVIVIVMIKMEDILERNWRNKEFVVTGEQYFRKSDNKNVDEIDEGWEELLLEDGDTWNSELVEIKCVEKVIWEIKENEKDDIIS